MTRYTTSLRAHECKYNTVGSLGLSAPIALRRQGRHVVYTQGVLLAQAEYEKMKQPVQSEQVDVSCPGDCEMLRQSKKWRL